MALEAEVYPQNSFGGEFNLQEMEHGKVCSDFLGNQTENYPYGEWNGSPSSIIPYFNGVNLCYTSSDSVNLDGNNQTPNLDASTAAGAAAIPFPSARSKRRRAKSRKNKEEIENQRMAHIAVERKRRKQMNEYLSVLRSLMPESYVQRSDQASIIGSAINFVKELEQSLQLLVAQKDTDDGKSNNRSESMPFSEFFAFPQFSTNPSAACDSPYSSMGEKVGQVVSGIADIEVTMVESHANLKIRLKRIPKQLLKIISGLHSLRLTILHLNLTTNKDTVLYSFTLKVEDDAKLGSADEIAAAVYKLLDGIHQETICMSH